MRAKLIFAVLALASFGQATVIWKTISNNNPNYWHAKARYPQFAGKSRLVTFANRDIRLLATETVASFVRDAKSLQPVPDLPPVPYELDSQGEVDLDSPTVLSIHFVEYVNTGGAHPNHFLPARSYGIIGGKPSRIRAADITSNLKGLSDVVLARIKRRPGSDWVNDGQVKELSKDQREMFVVTRKGLHYLFPPYEMGPYAAGSFEVDVAWSEIPGLKRSGVVSGLLSRR